MRVISRFSNLFKVEVRHDYFEGGICPDLDIVPTESCRRRMAEWGLIWRCAEGTLEVVAKEDPGIVPVSLKIPAAQDLRFVFLIRARNPLFQNYTRLPMPGRLGSIIYLHNRHEHTLDSSRFLHAPSGTHKVGEEDIIGLRPLRFLFSRPHASAGATVSLRNCFGSELWSRTVHTEWSKTVPPAEGRLALPVDLSPFGPGAYSLLVDGAMATAFYASDEPGLEKATGLVEILDTASIPAASRIRGAAGAAAPKVFTAVFAERRCYWRYHVVLRHRPAMDPALLTLSAADGTAFTRGAPADFAGSERAITFVSPQPMPLRNAPIKGLTLVKTGNTDNIPAFTLNNLPNPPPASLRPDIGTSAAFSDVILYV